MKKANGNEYLSSPKNSAQQPDFGVDLYTPITDYAAAGRFGMPPYEMETADVNAEPEDWQYFARQPRKPTSYMVVQNLFANKVPTDVEVHVGDAVFSCHRDVLRTYAKYFNELSDVDIVNIPAQKVSAYGFLAVYTWMLEDCPILRRTGIVETYRTAIYFCVEDLIEQCVRLFNIEYLFNEDTAFLLFWEARMYPDLENLQHMMLSRINKFFLSLVGTREFLSLTAREVFMLCSKDNIGVNAEMEVFLAVVHWLSWDWEIRKYTLTNVIRCVRFSLIPGPSLVQLCNNADCEQVRRVAQHPFVSDTINDVYVCIQKYCLYRETRNEFFVTFGAFQMNTPMRNWIVDKLCVFHHHLECFNDQHVTYAMFLKHLQFMNWRLLKYAPEISPKMICCLPCG